MVEEVSLFQLDKNGKITVRHPDLHRLNALSDLIEKYKQAAFPSSKQY